MIRVRVGATETRFPEGEWEAWVASGRVPSHALVFSLELTGGLWRRADEVELYEFFRQSGEDERREAALAQTAPPFAELPAVAFPPRGLSGTELLLGLNLTVALMLMLSWRADYVEKIWTLAWNFYNLLHDQHVPVGFLATLFMHADLQHLGANMLALVPSAAFVEYLFGSGVVWIYLLGGLGGALASLFLKQQGPMSVGASGAVYALIGACAGFLMRYRRQLSRWQRWKARRIYFPLLVLATLPAVFYADWRAHTGGLVSGILLGLIAPLHGRGRRLLLPAQAAAVAPVRPGDPPAARDEPRVRQDA